jgi:hypothetical protein
LQLRYERQGAGKKTIAVIFVMKMPVPALAQDADSLLYTGSALLATPFMVRTRRAASVIDWFARNFNTSLPEDRNPAEAGPGLNGTKSSLFNPL